MVAANGACSYSNLLTGVQELHYFFLGEEGSLQDTFFDNNWHPSLVNTPGICAVGILPIAMQYYGPLHVFYADVSGALAHSWYDLVGTQEPFSLF